MSSSKLNFYPSPFSDRSMLEALGGPGERSILSQKRRTGNGDRDEEKDESLGDEESQEDNDISAEVQVHRENDESPGSQAVDEWSEGKAEKKEEEEESEEKRENSEENSEEENMTEDKKGKSIFSFFMYPCLLFNHVLKNKKEHKKSKKTNKMTGNMYI